MRLVWVVIPLILVVSIIGIIGVQESFAEDGWYIGKDLKKGDYFHYSICHEDLNKCTPHEIGFWMNNQVSVIHNEKEYTYWDSTIVISNDEKSKVMKIQLDPILHPVIVREFSEYESILTPISWIGPYAPYTEPVNFEIPEWTGRGTPDFVISEDIETINIPAGTFDVYVITVGDDPNSKIWISEELSFPVKSILFEDGKKIFEFELIGFGNSDAKPSFFEIENNFKNEITKTILNNPKFVNFDDMLVHIDNGEFDDYSITLSVTPKPFGEIPESVKLERIELLEETLETTFRINYFVEMHGGILVTFPIDRLHDLAKVDVITEIRGNGFGFEYTADGSVLKSIVSGQLYDFPFSLQNGMIRHFKYSTSIEAGIVVDGPENNVLQMTFAREIIDPIDRYGEVGWIQAQGPSERYYPIIENNCDYRTLEFPLEYNYVTLKSIVTTSDVNPKRDEWRASITEDRFDFSHNNSDFEIITKQNGSICNLDFDFDTKKITIDAKGVIRTTDNIKVILPQHVLDGPFTVLVDGKESEFSYSETEQRDIISINHSFEKKDVTFEIIASEIFSKPEKNIIPTITVTTDKFYYGLNDLINTVGYISKVDEFTQENYVELVLINPKGEILHSSVIPVDVDGIFRDGRCCGTAEFGFIDGEYTIIAKYAGVESQTSYFLGTNALTIILSNPEISLSGSISDVINLNYFYHNIDKKSLQFSADVTNNGDTTQDFVYSIQATRIDNHKEDKPRWISGELKPGQTLTSSLSWQLDKPGIYQITLSAGNSLDNLSVQNSFYVTNGNTDVAILPEWVKNITYMWANGNYDDGLSSTLNFMIDHKIIDSDNTFDDSFKEIPSWVKNNAKWWVDGLISDAEYIQSIKYLMNMEII